MSEIAAQYRREQAIVSEAEHIINRLKILQREAIQAKLQFTFVVGGAGETQTLGVTIKKLLL